MSQNIKNSKINKNNYTCTITAFRITLEINKNNQNKSFHCALLNESCLFCFCLQSAGGKSDTGVSLAYTTWMRHKYLFYRVVR